MAAVPHQGPAGLTTGTLYERYSRQIFAFCLHQLGSREEAEDATQTTFLNAFRSLQRGIAPEFESAWLYKIAQNVCLTRRRSSSVATTMRARDADSSDRAWVFAIAVAMSSVNSSRFASVSGGSCSSCVV